MDFVHDTARPERLGMPEAIFCEGKAPDALAAIFAELLERGQPALFTRMQPLQAQAMPALPPGAFDYDASSRTGILHGTLPPRNGTVAVVTAGTSDLAVAREAARTLRFSGVACAEFADLGVAGIHRLFDRLDEIKAADIVLVVAGWDAALASVMGGLTGQPIIAVPSSTGYGVAAGGHTALNAMLASCGQGVLVTNIDNGFGAACGAIRILNQLDRTRP